MLENLLCKFIAKLLSLNSLLPVTGGLCYVNHRLGGGLTLLLTEGALELVT